MKPQLIIMKTLLLAIVIAVCSFSSASAKIVGTIILKSGVRYDNVEYDIFRDRKRVKFWIDREQKTLRFKHILTILHINGTEAFPKIFKDYDDNVEIEEVFEDSIQGEIMWEIAIKLGVLYGTQSGFYYQDLSNGVGINGEISIPIKNKTAIKLVYSSYVTDKIGENTPVLVDPNFLLQDFSFTATIQKFLLVIELIAIREKNNSISSIRYLNFGIGANTIKHQLLIKYFDNQLGRSFDAKNIDYDTRFAIAFGGGYIKKITKNFGVDLGGSLEIIATTRRSDNISERIYLLGSTIGAKIGLIYFFGHK